MGFGVRTVLRLGAIVFGASALLLLLVPELFLTLLGLDGASAPLTWSMRMIGVTLVALAGNMWLTSRNPDEAVIRRAGVLMCVAATALGILTLAIPAPLTWFAILYAAVGFGFGLAYLICLLRRRP